MRGMISILSIFMSRVPGKATKSTVRPLIFGWTNFIAMPITKPNATAEIVKIS